ncbi:unnamed protein product [Parnassius apollo]|uniref:(apollo) hypothetical protein n=1 Tax=Parnassius apollo TaxID=110799 RepID=A0A8S3XGU9_PARAO|nr:unnamed protein product [Parnassius apollo]
MKALPKSSGGSSTPSGPDSLATWETVGSGSTTSLESSTPVSSGRVAPDLTAARRAKNAAIPATRERLKREREERRRAAQEAAPAQKQEVSAQVGIGAQPAPVVLPVPGTPGRIETVERARDITEVRAATSPPQPRGQPCPSCGTARCPVLHREHCPVRHGPGQ